MPILIHIPMLIHIDVWQKPPQYCEIIILQLKKKSKTHGKKGRSKVKILTVCSLKHGWLFVISCPEALTS